MKKQKKTIPSERIKELAGEIYKKVYGKKPERIGTLDASLVDVNLLVIAIINYLDEVYEEEEKNKPVKPLWGLFKGLKISEREIERAKNFGNPLKQGYISECQHEWIWYPDETSTWKWAGYWRCKKCGLFKF